MSNRLHFKEIRYRNILSTGQMMTVVTLNRSPSTMITGKNGGGKSTLLDALYFALFGKPFRKINKPQLINTKNNKAMLVELDFTVGEDEYTVRRGQKPDIFEVIKNGERQNIQGDSRAFQQQFENSILRMNYDVAAQIMAIGKAQHVSFMRLDSAKRRLFVESILGLLIFGKMSQLHAVKMTQHKEKLVELKAAVGSAGDKVKVRTRYIADLKQSVIEAEHAQEEQSQAKIDHLQSFIAQSQARIQEIQNSMPDAVDIKAIQKRMNGLRELQTKFDMKIDDMTRRCEHLLAHEFCEACEQKIPEDIRVAKHAASSDKLKACRIARDDVASSLAAITDELERASRQMNERTRLSGDIQQLNYEVTRAGKEIDSLRQNKLEVATNLQAQIIAETESLTALVDTHNRLRDKYESLLQQTEYMNLVTGMLKDTGIKAMLIKKYLPIINHSINTNLANLGFFAKFTLSETFDETIQARGIDTLSYNNFSEGEKLRIDMAILMAWRDIARMHGGVSSNLLFLDEIMDQALDHQGIDSLLMLLKDMKDTNLFVITHNPEKMNDKIRSHIIFEKYDGFSRIKF